MMAYDSESDKVVFFGGYWSGPYYSDVWHAYFDNPPTALAGADQTVNEDVLMELNATSSFDNNQIDNYTWSFDDS